MELDPFSFADALLGVLAQRLARTLCKACKEEYDAHARGVRGDRARRTARALGSSAGHPLLADVPLYRAKGCANCGNTGYKGRIGIHELLVATDEIKRHDPEARARRGDAQAGDARAA